MAQYSWSVLQFVSGRWVFDRRRWRNAEDMIGLCIALGFFWGALFGAVRLAVVAPAGEPMLASAITAENIARLAAGDSGDALAARTPAAAALATQ